MIMDNGDTRWLVIPGADAYEVSEENNPRVRNRKTWRVLSANWQNQVTMYIKGRGHMKRSGDRCLYAAINNVPIEKIPYDVLIKYVDGEFRIEYSCEKNKYKKIPADEVHPMEVKLNHLDECIEFCMLQKRLLKDNHSDRLYSFLCLYRERVFYLCRSHFHRGEVQLARIGITFEAAVADLVIRIKECKYITMHPTLALYEEIRKSYYKRRKRKEVVLMENNKRATYASRTSGSQKEFLHNV